MTLQRVLELDWRTQFGYGMSYCLHSWVLKQKANLDLLRHHLSCFPWAWGAMLTCSPVVKAGPLPTAKLQVKAGGEAGRPTAGPGHTLGIPKAPGESSDTFWSGHSSKTLTFNFSNL